MSAADEQVVVPTPDTGHVRQLSSTSRHRLCVDTAPVRMTRPSKPGRAAALDALAGTDMIIGHSKPLDALLSAQGQVPALHGSVEGVARPLRRPDGTRTRCSSPRSPVATQAAPNPPFAVTCCTHDDWTQSCLSRSNRGLSRIASTRTNPAMIRRPHPAGWTGADAVRDVERTARSGTSARCVQGAPGRTPRRRCQPIGMTPGRRRWRA